jgi:hypothetical protein
MEQSGLEFKTPWEKDSTPNGSPLVGSPGQPGIGRIEDGHDAILVYGGGIERKIPAYGGTINRPAVVYRGARRCEKIALPVRRRQLVIQRNITVAEILGLGLCAPYPERQGKGQAKMKQMSSRIFHGILVF